MAAAPQRPKTRTSSMCLAEALQGTHRFEVAIDRAIGECVSSDIFAVGGHEWRIRFYRQLTNATVSLDLMSEGVEDDKVEARVCYDFRLLNRATGLFFYVESGCSELRDADSLYWSTHTFMEMGLLQTEPYIQDGRVVIECNVTVEKETVEVEVPPSDLVCHLGELLKAEEEADVAFEVQGEVFHAHKIILAARSKVFMELLYGSMSDKEMRSVRVEDTEPDAFKALLHFIYMDSLPDMDDLDGDNNEETIWRLLVAAEKYAVEGMKLLCINILRKRLDNKRVTRTFALAEKYRCSKVQDACIEFMKRECPAVYIDILKKAARNRKI